MKLDLIVTAREIITLDPTRPRAQKMGVLHGKIVGFDEELDGLNAHTVKNFANAIVTPGFIDAHCHTTWWGLGLTALRLDQARGLDELYDMISRKCESLPDSPEVWIHGTGFNQKHHAGQFPDIKKLDAITGSRSLYLRHTSGHCSITNSATLQRAGVFETDFQDPDGGVIVRDDRGYPTGVIEETAQSLLQGMLLPYAQESIVEALEAATKEYAKLGITTFAEAGIGGGWIGHSPIEIAAYQRAVRQNKLHARACLMPALDSLQALSGHASDFKGEGVGLGLGIGEHFGFGNERVQLGHVKVFLDGSLLGHTAAVTEAFCGHDHNKGYLLASPDEYREQVAAVYRAGWPIAMHGIGDVAIDLALDIIEQCQKKYGLNGAVNRIEHFGISRPDQVQRAGELGIAVTPQAGFIGPLGDQFVKSLGASRESFIYRGRSVIDAGAVLAGSSDLPVADNNILRGMQSAVDRRTDSGSYLAKNEAITPLEALRSYTEWAAVANGVFETRGNLVVGKFADFVVLSKSPLVADDMNTIDVLATFVGGQASFESSAA